MSNPAFSPDGKTLAFSAKYNGNTDVFVVPVEGGAADAPHLASRGRTSVQGFTPDGKQVLFTSPRAVYTGRYTQLFTVPTRPAASRRRCRSRTRRGPRTRPTAAGSPTTRSAPAFLQWKHYRGGQVSHDQHLRHADARRCRRSPQPEIARERRRSDVGRRHACTSAPTATASSTSIAFDAKAKAVKQITQHADFPVLDAAAGGGHIIYEQAGYLHLLDPGDRQVAAAEVRRARRTSARRASASSAARSGSEPRRCRRPVPAPPSSSAARSSRFRPRRATSAT